MRFRGSILAATVLLAAAAAVGGGVAIAVRAPPKSVSAIGGPFTLVDDSGTRVTEAVLADKPTVLYFGYTFCPDICPTTLTDLSRWIAQLGADADKLNFVFVTVDPERDTPQVLHEYLSSFDGRIRGLTGTSREISTIAREYRVYFKRIPTDDGGYVMDHSAVIYLLRPGGKLEGFIAYQENDQSALAKIRGVEALAR